MVSSRVFFILVWFSIIIDKYGKYYHFKHHKKVRRDVYSGDRRLSTPIPTR